MRTFVIPVLSLLLLAGCRREDIRTMTVEIPDLTPQNRAVVFEAIAKYSGVNTNSLNWDFERKTLTLSYDSMQVAQSNIRYAIDERGIKVKFPEKTDDHAGH